MAPSPRNNCFRLKWRTREFVPLVAVKEYSDTHIYTYTPTHIPGGEYSVSSTPELFYEYVKQCKHAYTRKSYVYIYIYISRTHFILEGKTK